MCNIGLFDRFLRGIVGLFLISLVFIGPRTIWGWVGLIPLITAIVAYCPMYTVLGFNGAKDTHKTHDSH